MNYRNLCNVAIAACFLGVVIFSFQGASGSAPLQAPSPPPPPTKPPPPPTTFQGGWWIDNFLSTVNLSQNTNLEIYGTSGRLRLGYQELLDWNQTWTEHFLLGEFYHTEAISDSVQLSWNSGSNQFYQNGIYTSTILNTGRLVYWYSADWSYSQSPGALSVEFHSGNVSTPDGTWSQWNKPTGGGGGCVVTLNTSLTTCKFEMNGIPGGRFLQYRAMFTNTVPDQTDALNSIRTFYGIHTITGTATSIAIPPSDLLSWNQIFFTPTVPASTSLSVDVLSANNAILLSNAIPGDSLAIINPTQYPSLKLRVTMTTTSDALTPEMDAWGLQWNTNYRKYFPIISR